MQLHILRSVADAIALPEGRKEKKLQRELAATLYREGMLSFGKALELADLDKFAFAQLLGKRGIERHYGEDELDEDLVWCPHTHGDRLQRSGLQSRRPARGAERDEEETSQQLANR